MVERIMNPLLRPEAPVGQRVRSLTGVTHWPKGLCWYTTWLGGPPKRYATYTIKARGRKGAKARQKLMARPRKFAINVSERVRP